MPIVRMYSTRICPYCLRAEQLLTKKGVSIQKILVDDDPQALDKMIELTGRRTVPQIFIGEHPIGGYDDLAALETRGELDLLLQIC